MYFFVCITRFYILVFIYVFLLVTVAKNIIKTN